VHLFFVRYFSGAMGRHRSPRRDKTLRHTTKQTSMDFHSRSSDRTYIFVETYKIRTYTFIERRQHKISPNGPSGSIDIRKWDEDRLWERSNRSKHRSDKGIDYRDVNSYIRRWHAVIARRFDICNYHNHHFLDENHRRVQVKTIEALKIVADASSNRTHRKMWEHLIGPALRTLEDFTK
jgi:hypothetical protein